MIIAIGNAPSSGSTFLADLLDSLPFAVCGPEIGLFSSIKYFNEFRKIKGDNRLTSKSPAIYLNRQRLLAEDMWAYGIHKHKIEYLFRDSDSFVQFCNKLFVAFASFRKKDCKLFFEKTPQNIHCARKFLDTFEDGFFLHIVRNPLFVYKSLIRRKFPPYIAANTWLIDVSQTYPLRNHPRFIEIKYETLAEQPFDTISAMLQKIGAYYPPNEIEKLYKKNRYRKEFTKKIDVWEINRYGVLGNANKKIITKEDIKALNYMLKTKTSRRYAQIFAFEALGFNELIKHHGYCGNEIFSQVELSKSKAIFDYMSYIKLFRKFLGDLKFNDCRLSDFFAYLRPVGTQKCVG